MLSDDRHSGRPESHNETINLQVCKNCVLTNTKLRCFAEDDTKDRDMKMTTPTINELVRRDDLNFRMFLSTARITDDIQGDLIADMKRAGDLPNDFIESDQLRRYLRDRRACDGAVDAVRVSGGAIELGSTGVIQSTPRTPWPAPTQSPTARPADAPFEVEWDHGSRAPSKRSSRL